MKTPVPGKPIVGAFALALILGSLQVHPAIGQDGGQSPPPSPKKPWDDLFHKRPPVRLGTLGYGAPGLHPGIQGFGLGYHRGYGYGGDALGVGSEGGYPLYGGPGYPHPPPALRRIGGIVPFCHYGGPGGPSPDYPNFFAGDVPLAPDSPVVIIPPDSPSAGDYGPFTGTISYLESTFAPFVTEEAGDSSRDTSASRPTTRSQPMPRPRDISPSLSTAEAVQGSPDARSLLGVDTDAVVDAGSARGIKVTRLQPGSVGDKAGLKVGDVIRSANGYLTEQPGHLSWIIDNATPGGVITLTVLAASDGELRTISVRRP